MGLLSAILDRLFVLAGALIFSQAPLFMQQYVQQLSGHAAELHYQVQKLEVAALESEKPLPDYIDKFLKNSDADFARQGKVMRGMVERWGEFNLALASLQSASIVAKPFLLIGYLNVSVATATWQSFELGLSFTVESLAYACLGAFTGYLMFALLSFLFKGAGRLVLSAASMERR